VPSSSAEKANYTSKIYAKHFVPLPIGHAGQRCVAQNARISNRAINSPKVLKRMTGELVYRFGICDIQGQHDRRSTLFGYVPSSCYRIMRITRKVAAHYLITITRSSARAG
jgi:hypothetical protein